MLGVHEALSRAGAVIIEGSTGQGAIAAPCAEPPEPIHPNKSGSGSDYWHSSLVGLQVTRG